MPSVNTTVTTVTTVIIISDDGKIELNINQAENLYNHLAVILKKKVDGDN